MMQDADADEEADALVAQLDPPHPPEHGMGMESAWSDQPPSSARNMHVSKCIKLRPVSGGPSKMFETGTSKMHGTE